MTSGIDIVLHLLGSKDLIRRWTTSATLFKVLPCMDVKHHLPHMISKPTLLVMPHYTCCC